jgi:serine/threonine-protein kinase
MLLNNRYQVLQILGRGGFGETFLTADLQMPSQRRCVIKQLKPVTNDPQVYQLIQERFAREAAVLEKLGDRCSQIPRLYAYFTENEQFYLVQELVEGITLTAKVREFGRASENEVREILISLLSVLDCVHGQGIVHRDIKPDNIILRHLDSKPVLIDFGAVRETVATELSSQGQATSSIVIGTPGFMPSEQGIGRPVYASDLYSLGLTAIYLLTGKMPQEFPNDPTTGEIIWDREAVSSSLADALDRAVRSHPRDRFPTAKAMLEVLDRSSLPPTQQVENYNPTLPTPQEYRSQPTIPIQISTQKDWQKPAIIGGLIGILVVGGLAVSQNLIAPNASNPTPSPVNSPGTQASSPVQSNNPGCGEQLSSNLGRYEGTSTIVNSPNRTSGKFVIDINFEANSSCVVVAKVEEFDPLGGQGTVSGKFDPNSGRQVNLLGSLSHQTKPKVWDVEMNLRFIDKNTIEGRSTWIPKSGIEDNKTYYEEFTAAKSAVDSSSIPSPTVRDAVQPVALKTLPEEFIRGHYLLLNQRRYQDSWENLTDNFRGKSDNFSNYINWWDSVSYTEVSAVKLLEKSDNRAILDVKLKLHLKKGTVSDDPNSRIYLIWDESSNSWKIDRKEKP